MTIVCGTDFSENAAGAARAAAAIAKRSGARLQLVHVVQAQGATSIHDDAAYDPLRRRLRGEADHLSARQGIEVEPIVVSGAAYEKLVETACNSGAALIVVSALGVEKQHCWSLGSTAERVAQTSSVPILIVRDSASLEAWAAGETALRVMVGVELASTSKAALGWAAALRAIGRCDLLITQVAWPLGEHFRLGVPSPIPLDQLRPEVHEPMVRDLRAWAGDLPGGGETTFNVSAGWGRVDTHLASLAQTAGAHLLVVGTHQRAGSARLWQGSVSRGVLHHTSCNVACIPRGDTAEDGLLIPTFRRVLVPTDFSALANRAIPVGYGLVGSGGIVHLLHVVARKDREEEVVAAERLRGLIPPGAAARSIVTAVVVVEDEHAYNGIWHAAGRLGVDAICMATHGRSGVSQIILGSQAQQVVHRVRQPVLLVPPERED